MTDASNTEWASVILFFGPMIASSFVFGQLATQVSLRLMSRGKRSSYQKWGVDKELFRPESIVWLIGSGVVAAISLILTFYLAFLSITLVTEATTTAIDRFQTTLLFAMYAVFIGFTVEYQRFKKIADMTKKLDDLKEPFHEKFPISELLSMYEELRPAPPLFWEEYAGLTDDQVSQQTNRIYRERAAPYGHSRSIRYSKIVIVVAALTLLVAAISAVKGLLS